MVAARLNGAGRRARPPCTRAGKIRNSRRAAEFTGDNHHHALVEPALVQILDQSANRLVVIGGPQLHRLEDVVIDGMVVPVAHASAQFSRESCGDELDARFDQPAGHQALLPPTVAAVSVAHFRFLAAQVEGVSRRRVGEHVPGLRFEFIERQHRAGLVDVAANHVELFS